MGLSRRSLLATLALPAFSQSRPATLPTEWGRYPDPATETEVQRLTSAEHSSVLPLFPAKAADRRSKTLLFASDRTGSWQALLMDVTNGQSRVLPAQEAMDPASICLSADDRSVYLASGPSVVALALATMKSTELASIRDGWTRTGAIVGTEDGTSVFYVESKDGASQLRRVRTIKSAAEVVTEHPSVILEAAPNPRRATVLWRSEAGEAWVAGFDGAGKRRLETPDGRVLQAQWAADGQSILYLLQPADSSQLHCIREQGLDSRSDALVAKTSQFVAFSRNANATVFVGASRSKASPTVLLMLRATRREFTLCEHKSSDPHSVAPLFTPNSQRVLFQSDRHGRPAIYQVNVERLIEKTES